MARKEDWHHRLHDALLARTETPFQWGRTDCLMTVSDMILAMTGNDPAAQFRGKYASKIGASRIATKAGCTSFEELVEKLAAANGFAEINPKMAQRGDLVVFDDTEGPAFGIVHLNGWQGVCAGENGLKVLPALTARRAWRVQ